VVPSYYLRYYYQHDEVVAELREQGSRAAQVAEIERQLLRLYADPTLDSKPELLGKRGGAFYSEAAVQLIAALLGTGGGGPDVQVVNTRNDGVLPFLPDDAVIEVPAQVDATGVRPLPQRPVEPLFAGLIAAVTAYEHLALDAALKGGRERVFDALLAHPLVGRIALADRLTDALLAHNEPYLSWI
jgi:6-phospho-beta-glucosidase